MSSRLSTGLSTALSTAVVLLSTLLLAGPLAADRAPSTHGPFVGDAVEPQVLEMDLSRLPKVDLRVDPGAAGLIVAAPLPAAGEPLPEGELSVPELASATPRDLSGTAAPGASRAPLGSTGSAAKAAGPGLNFPGIGFTNIRPPDTQGDVGPNHYIQVVNGSNLGVTSSFFEIWDKSGNSLAGPSTIASLWSSGTCAGGGFDPVVLYDQLADRWVITQVGGFFASQCIAVSMTPNPVSGGWFLFDFPTPGITNDYPKLTVWPDAYYMSSQRGYPNSGSDAWAFDRATMLTGGAATFVRFFNSSTFFLPSDLGGATLPPSGAPNVFARFVDGAQFGGSDRLELFAFHVDFATPANSTFTALPSLNTDPFDRNMCGLSLHGPCIPQPGTGVTLAAFTAWPLWSLQYRNFGVHESLVFNHTVDVDGTDHAGIRWYELRDPGGGWGIFQQGSYAPDSDHRWMGSVALDGAGNMGLGFSIANGTSLFPSIRRSGRLASDPLGTITQAETTVMSGSGSQTASFRWGDYSAMAVDPVDDRTLWYTTEYIPANGNWETQITSFTLPAGVLDVQRVTATTFSATTNVQTVTCPAGRKVIGGGCQDLYTSTRIRTTAPRNEGWLCVFEDFEINNIPLGFSTHAYCLAGNVDIGLEAVTNTTFAATTNVQLANCPAGKRIVGGGCNDLYTSTRVRTSAPRDERWLCIHEHAEINNIPLGFSTTAFCVNDYVDIGQETVVTTTTAATTNVQVATCPAGKKLLGGGCDDFYTSTRLRSTGPGNSDDWVCVFEDYQINNIPLGFGAFAFCGQE